jgi:hypothetical protein
MTLVKLSRFISSSLNLRFFKNSENFKFLSKDSLTEKSMLCRLTGEASMRSLTPFSVKLVLLTSFLVLMLINRMEQQKESIGT